MVWPAWHLVEHATHTAAFPSSWQVTQWKSSCLTGVRPDTPNEHVVRGGVGVVVFDSPAVSAMPPGTLPSTPSCACAALVPTFVPGPAVTVDDVSTFESSFESSFESASVSAAAVADTLLSALATSTGCGPTVALWFMRNRHGLSCWTVVAV